MYLNEKLSSRKAVITGASGFIGARVLAGLVASGANVQAIVRSGAASKAVQRAGANAISGGMDDAVRLRSVLAEADVLINLAYDMRASAEANLSAFDQLLDAADGAGVSRIIHASSIVVYDDWLTSDLTETMPSSTSSGGPYRQAKIAMEQRLKDRTSTSIVLQPTIVYGPKSYLWTTRILTELKTGPVVLPDPTGLCNAVYVDDVAQAVLRAATADIDGCERFIINGADTPSWRTFYEGYQTMVPESELRFEPLEDLRERLGPRAPELEQSGGPSAAARVSSALRGIVGKDRFESLVGKARVLAARGAPHYPDHNALEMLTSEGRCRSDKASKLLGYKPVYDLMAGMDAISKTS